MQNSLNFPIPKNVLLTNEIEIDGNRYFKIISKILELFNDSAYSFETKVFRAHRIILDEISLLNSHSKPVRPEIDLIDSSKTNYANQAHLLLSLCLSSCLPYSGKKNIDKGWKFIFNLAFDISKAFIKIGKININKWKKEVVIADVDKIRLSQEYVTTFYKQINAFFYEQINQGLYLRFKTIFDSSGIFIVTTPLAKWLIKACVSIDKEEKNEIQIKKVLQFIQEDISFSNSGFSMLLESIFSRYFYTLVTNEYFVWSILNSVQF